ncbi:hypothetical protein HanRHA438_Chr17g0794451 [Helianthus annuus]|nr:hypothetical protein HanRHA438_Chr17g0794451 [Helianthus annuus]
MPLSILKQKKNKKQSDFSMVGQHKSKLQQLQNGVLIITPHSFFLKNNAR